MFLKEKFASGLRRTMSAPTPAGREATKMDPEEYLDRYGVTAYLKDVVTLLIENRPAQPIEFVLHYFRTVTQGSSPMLRAYRYVRLAAPDCDAFMDNLVAAYSAIDVRRGAGSVTGAELLRLMRILLSEQTIDVSRSVLVLIDKSEGDSVSFREFNAAVRTACATA